MVRIIVGVIVGTLIFSFAQAIMWVDGHYKDIWLYSPKQDSLFEKIKAADLPEGMYSFPAVNPATPTGKQREIYTDNIGKPWATLFYHRALQDNFQANGMKSFMHAFFCCLIACLFIYFGAFPSFLSRFLAGWAFGLFAALMGPMNDLNWKGFPWSLVRAELTDLIVIWGVTCIWFAIYVKRKKTISPKAA